MRKLTKNVLGFLMAAVFCCMALVAPASAAASPALSNASCQSVHQSMYDLSQKASFASKVGKLRPVSSTSERWAGWYRYGDFVTVFLEPNSAGKLKTMMFVVNYGPNKQYAKAAELQTREAVTIAYYTLGMKKAEMDKLWDSFVTTWSGKAWCSQMGCNFIMYVPAQTFEKLEKENLLIFELSATN